MSGYTFAMLDDLEREPGQSWLARIVLPQVLPLARAELGDASVGIRTVAQRIVDAEERANDAEARADEAETAFFEATGEDVSDWLAAKRRKARELRERTQRAAERDAAGAPE